MKICSVDDCPARAVTRGWCDKHYRRWMTTGDPNTTLRTVTTPCMDGCGRQAKYGNGMCGACYERHRKAGTLDRRCVRCLEAPVLGGFRYCEPCADAVKVDQRERYARQKRERFWATAVCPDCKTAPARRSTAGIQPRAKLCSECAHRRSRSSRLRHHYGVDVDWYERTLRAQDGACAICRDPSARSAKSELLVIDHDHASGEVRGLLCHACNVGLGNFRDNPSHLLAAVSYLARQNARAA